MTKDLEFFIIAVLMLAITLYFIATVNASEGAIQRLSPTLSSGYIAELNNAFNKASAKHNVDVDLLIAMAYYESSFRSGVKGDHGRSWGIMQVGIMARRVCGYDKSVEGQIMSGACWYRAALDWCKSERGALTAYAFGTCSNDTPRAKWLVNKRLRLAKRIRI